MPNNRVDRDSVINLEKKSSLLKSMKISNIKIPTKEELNLQKPIHLQKRRKSFF